MKQISIKRFGSIALMAGMAVSTSLLAHHPSLADPDIGDNMGMHESAIESMLEQRSDESKATLNRSEMAGANIGTLDAEARGNGRMSEATMGDGGEPVGGTDTSGDNSGAGDGSANGGGDGGGGGGNGGGGAGGGGAGGGGAGGGGAGGGNGGSGGGGAGGGGAR